jgi:hypothetical protein
VVLRVLKARHLEIIWEFKVRLGVPFERCKVDNERVFNCENGVVVDVLARAVEDLRDYGLIAWRGELYHC